MSNKQEEKYSLFNGRRSADEYVKGYLKGILAISSAGLAVFMAFGGWVVLQISSQDDISSGHEIRLTKIESSRFTIKDGQAMADKINNNAINFSRLEAGIRAVQMDLEEIKSLLRRAAPYEIKEK